MIDFYRVPQSEVEKIEWTGDHLDYDLQLSQLGAGHDEFLVYNPGGPTLDFDRLPPTPGIKCIVWRYNKIWVAKYFKQGWEPDMGYWPVELGLEWEYNTDIPNNLPFVSDPRNLPIQDLYDLNYQMTWYLDPKFNIIPEKVWVLRCKLFNCSVHGNKDMGYLEPNIPKRLDVVFISYNEPNAEENWQRVLEKAPDAYRVNGVRGIVNAHRSAAKLATTDMFYVVDGDAYLEDSWQFDFQPTLFDRDCVHVWRSQNPVNELKYGYGGVKLLPTALTLNMDITNPDMTTSISNKFKVMAEISNITAFNTDEFSAWRSAFRECAKLAGNILQRRLPQETEKRLQVWCTVGQDRPLGEWAIKGAIAGKNFGLTHKGDQQALAQINDFAWLKSKFDSEKSLNI